MTFSGGEPLLQRAALVPIFRRIREAGFHVALDTNGAFLDGDTHALLAETDLVLLDIKQMDTAKHQYLTGHNNAGVLAFAEYLESIHRPFWVRYVLVE